MTVYLRIPVVCCLGLDYVCLSNSSSLPCLASCIWMDIVSLSLYRKTISRTLCVPVTAKTTAIDGHARMARLPAKCMSNLSSTSLPIKAESHNNIRYVYLGAHINFRSSVNSFRAIQFRNNDVLICRFRLTKFGRRLLSFLRRYSGPSCQFSFSCQSLSVIIFIGPFFPFSWPLRDRTGE